MKQKNNIFLIVICIWLLIALVPSNSLALYNRSFDQTVTDYFYLKFTDQNLNISAVTNTSLPAVNTNWMIEVTSLIDGPPTDNISVTVYEDTGGYLDKWQLTSPFGGEIGLGSYSPSSYTIDPAFEALFPLPFIIPTKWTAAFNQTLNASLTNTHNFDHYQFQNLSGLIPPEMAGMLPIAPIGLIVAWNGSTMWIDTDTNGSGKMEPYGNVTGNFMLVGLYMEDGELNYATESEWDNGTQQWNLIYKLKSPIMELLGGLFEGMLPGSGVTGGGGGGIPGFPYTLVFLGLMVTVAIIYLRKSKEKIII